MSADARLRSSATRRLTHAVTGALALLCGVLGAMLSVAFIVLMIAGNVYRTECTLPSGVHTSGWEFPTSIPYLWSAGDGCESHTLTRYLLGKVGVMREVN
jgi:hypothetical protein